MIWVWLAWLASPAGADPLDALGPVAQRLYVEGQVLEAEGAYREAARRYEQVAQLDPAWKQAVVSLGRVYALAGDPAAAGQAYARAPSDAVAVEALGRLAMESEDYRSAAQAFERLASLRPEWPGAVLLRSRALSEVDIVRAAELLDLYLSFHAATLDDEGVVQTVVRVAETLRAEGRDAEAATLLEGLVARFPTARSVESIDELLLDYEVEEQALRLADAAHVPLQGDQIDRLVTARQAMAVRAWSGAEPVLSALVAEAPHNAVVWATLSEVREALGDVEGAEQAIRVAERLDPLEESYPARLGDLLSRWFGGRFDTEAAAAYGRAVRRRGADADLWFRKGNAERRAGSWVRAQASYARALELQPDGPMADEARIEVQGAARQRLPPADIPAAPGRPDTVPEAAWLAFHRAWAWRERADSGSPGALERSLSELETTRSLAPRFVRALNLEAAIRVGRDERPLAISLYEESLAVVPEQDPVMVVLAELYRQAGRDEPADVLLSRAAALGNPDALWAQAGDQAQGLRWWAARDTLDRYMAQSMPSADSYDAARALRDSVQARIHAVQLGGLAAIVGVVGLPLWWRRRSRHGVGIGQLLERAPGAYRDVARVLSAIRHEVLKHNTTVLGVVADALDDGDPDPAFWAAERLFAPRGAVVRFRGYIGELVQLGGAHGVHLNLRWRDPVLGPLIAAMDGLSAVERDLRAGRGRRLAETLRQLSDRLNTDGYRALGRLLADICVLQVHEALVRDVYAAVAAEPAFRAHQRLPLEVQLPTEPIVVRLFRSDLEDILANLLRNSLAATVEAANADRLGVRVALEDDPITGIERVQLRVLDNSPRRLSTAMIRGRYIGRGLGLAVDLISRAGGSIHVEAEPGWSKAVVVRFDRAEVDVGELD